MPAPPTYDHLEGHRFPGGDYHLPAHEAWLWADAVGGDPRAEVAHPALAYMIGLHGGGASVQDIFDLLEADADSGVLFGEIELDLAAPIVAGRDYRVEGEVLSVERKEGRRAGMFDRVTFQHRIHLVGEGEGAHGVGDSRGGVGEQIAAVTHTWIFPRAAA